MHNVLGRHHFAFRIWHFAMVINQWVPAAHRGDAIGDSARRVRDLLRDMGHDADLFALTIDDDLKGEVRPFADGAARHGDLTIFHFALPSPMTAAFASLDGGRVLQYHNITPRRFSRPTIQCCSAGSARPRGLSTLVGRSIWRSAIRSTGRARIARLRADGFLAVDRHDHPAGGTAGAGTDLDDEP